MKNITVIYTNKKNKGNIASSKLFITKTALEPKPSTNGYTLTNNFPHIGVAEKPSNAITERIDKWVITKDILTSRLSFNPIPKNLNSILLRSLRKTIGLNRLNKSNTTLNISPYFSHVVLPNANIPIIVITEYTIKIRDKAEGKAA